MTRDRVGDTGVLLVDVCNPPSGSPTWIDPEASISVQTPVEEAVKCVGPGHVVMAITGLPGVAGVYDSRALSFETSEVLYGFGFGGDLLNDPRAQQDLACFVAPNQIPFRTSTIWTQHGIEAFDFDVGVSVGGEDGADRGPFVGLNVTAADVSEIGLGSDGEDEDGASTAGASTAGDLAIPYELTYVYEAGLTGAPVDVDTQHVQTDDNAFAGYAQFSTTFYNVIDYRNYLTPEGPSKPGWVEGSTTHLGTIRLWCGG